MPSRHPITRTLEIFVASAVLVLAAVTTILIAETQVRVRDQELDRRLATTVRAVVNVLDLVGGGGLVDSAGRTVLGRPVTAALHEVVHGAGEEIVVAVLDGAGNILWSIGEATGSLRDTTLQREAGAVALGRGPGGRHTALGGLRQSDWTVLAQAPGARIPLTLLMLRDIGLFALVGLLLFYTAWRLLDLRVLQPLGVAEGITARVAQGDLQVDDATIDRVGGGPLTEGLRTMIRSLVRLVGAIRSASQDSAALAEEISAATEQMTSATEEVAATTADLTNRATGQAALVRTVSEDASRILGIAQDLAAGALQAAERNSALAKLAETHRAQLGAGVAELDRLAEEAARGAEEAQALSGAAEEIGQFIAQSAAIARQTHLLALNAALEAARAGEEGKGFTVVADEVRRLAGQAGRAAAETRETVGSVVARVNDARERLVRLSERGGAARQTAQAAAEGLASVADQAVANDEWTRGISGSAGEVRKLIDDIAQKTTQLSAGTEDYAAAAEEIAAAAQELNASTEEVAASATRLAEAAVRLTDAVGSLRI